MISNYLQSNHLIPNSNKMNDPNINKSIPPSADLANSSLKKKNIPIELTAYGTTPSGKPRLFVCQACTRAFARLEHLRRHERSHTKEKPFSCGVCQRKFSRRDLLLRHAQKLHAGCSDAITRLRRKSIKRTSGDDEDQNLDDDVVMTESQSASPQNQQNVEFNLDSFSKNNEAKIVKPKISNSTSSSSSNPITRKNSLLQRQLFQSKKSTPNRRKRGTSFSAQSGANYAMVPDYHDNYPNTENVGFSTPQLNATSMNDEISWLNNLSTIPGMLSDKAFDNHNNNTRNNNSTNTTNKHKRPSLSDLRQNSISSYTDGSLSHKQSLVTDISHPGSFSLSHDQSLNPSFNDLSYMLPTATMANHEFQKGIKENNRKDKVDYGYSFYDIPETMLTGKPFDSVTEDMDHVNTNNNHFNDNTLRDVNQQFKTLAPIKQEDDENGFPDNHAPSQTPNQNYDLNFLNDIDKLTHEYDVNSKFMPNGYSFYGDDPSVASSGIEDSPYVFSPQVSMNPNGNMTSQQSRHPQGLNMDQNQFLHLETRISQGEIDFSNVPNPTNNFNFNICNNNPDHQSIMKSKSHSNYSKNKLFTNNMRHMINKSLGKYPISGIMTPSIPSNEKLELYLTTFIQVFLTHFPFIHNSKLNEYDIMNMTSNEDPNNESARVCLPLLIATMGALLANNKNDSEHLYEASRRTIHIYLESRKNSMNNDDKKEKSTVNPLWLIQSLTLSVVYGLFSDNENNVYIVIRQLNALNSLVKTSIKSNRRILFSINGEDEEIFNKLNPDGIIGNPDALLGSSLFSNSFNDELKFKNNINIQSQSRIVFMIYRLTNFLLMMYNVPLTLSINDLQNIALPNEDDELLWSFKSYQDFQEYCQFTNSNLEQGQISLDDKLNGEKIIYKDLLFSLTKMNDPNQMVDQTLINSQLVQLSKVGFISLVHGIYEIQQYEDMKYFDVHGLLDYITKFIPVNSMTYETQKHYKQHQQQTQSIQRHDILHDYEKLDFALLANYIKISSLINFKLVKEQSWLRNYDELSKNFNIFLIEHNPNNPTNKLDDYSYLKVVDCCIMIIKLILFKSEVNSDGPNLSRASLINLEYSKLEHNEENTLETFEKDIHVRIFDELDNTHHSIHSQMLFHVFAILSLFSIYVLKKNNPNYLNLTDNSADGLFELNRRFSMVLKLLDKIESFLKVKYNSNGSSKLEQDFTNLYLFGANPNTNGANTSELLDNISGAGDGNASYSLEKTLYILKVGECVLNYLYDTNVKISIYKKLSGSMLHIRKFLIENESRVLS